VALDVEDLAFDLLVTIRASKTDQEQAGAQVAVPFARAGNDLCAVRTLRAYLEAGWDPPRPGVQRAAPRRHPVIDQRLSDQSVALIVKRRARTAGVPAAELSGHSLRAGYATAAAAAGVEERKIANVTRHKNLPVLRRYIRTRHRRSTTSATCSDPKPTQGSVGVPPFLVAARGVWVGGPRVLLSASPTRAWAPTTRASRPDHTAVRERAHAGGRRRELRSQGVEHGRRCRLASVGQVGSARDGRGDDWRRTMSPAREPDARVTPTSPQYHPRLLRSG
jgi:hypothetical protein